jgi:hypothetical protein
MNGCGIDFDPTTVQTTIDRCVAILQEPSSPANLMRGLIVVSMLGFALVCALMAFRAANV